MKIESHHGFATRQIHAGKEKNPKGALATPIYQTSTFEFDSVKHGGACFAGESEGYIYTRLGNPSLKVVEKKIASLEGGEACLAAASGMGAISSSLWTALSSGDEIIADETLYGCTYSLLAHQFRRFGIVTTFCDLSDPGNLRDALTERTKVVYFETPCNPTLKIIDIESVAGIAHAYNPAIKVFVDNTFCSPYLQTPLAAGADVIVHSATKYLNGHGDVIGGFVVSDEAFIADCTMIGLKDLTGAVMSPFNAYLIERGLKTLDLRMEKHCSNAEKIARYLLGHPAVTRVYYPGFEDFPGHETAKRQMRRFGGMIAVEFNMSRDETAAAIDNLELCVIAVSLGDAETLVEQPATMTHSTYSGEELKASGISESLVRISVGLEDAEDIIADFERVLRR
ncbi:MAG TPA: aminotransferase class I/II-fold pyridoxal phosphate-dependent enzyme [Bacillota bacterium]|nr:aminotransferase class I/II-fold pyridoxal phosphate-dependent enzyme [Bacillota bacterium]